MVDQLYDFGYDVRTDALTFKEIGVILEAIKAIIAKIESRDHPFHKVSDKLVDITPEDAQMLMDEFAEDMFDE